MSKIIITVTRPELTAEEKENRMEEIKKATADFMRAVARAKDEKSSDTSFD